VDEAPHGRAFAETCATLGIDARASGLPDGGVSEGTHGRILDRVAKLLRLAEGADANEAAAAASAAQRLILKYNLSHRVGDAGPEYGYRHLGVPTGRVAEAERILATILTEHFFVQAIWISVWRPLSAKRGQVLEICGEHDNLELASYVHHYLLATAERLFLAYQEEQGTRSRAHRREFVAGVMVGFRERLNTEKKKSLAEGLVWVGDAKLGDFMKSRHPDIRWIHTPARRRPDAWARGREAGQSIELRRPLHEKPARGPRMLGPKR
jgi:hypothetical protein